jgi:polyribonucleotide nucleotidyltransferase
MFIRKEVEIGGKILSIETGKLAKQANGAVMIGLGETMTLVTAVAAEEAGEDRGFFPLSVEYREKTYSAGKIPGGFIKREARPSEKEILSARLIDRPIRPLFPDTFLFETQIIANVLSLDKENDADVLAGIGASAALSISNIPFNGPIATVRVVKLGGEYIIFPSREQVENAELELVVAGSEESIMMVEGEAQEVSEDVLLQAIATAHESIKKIIELQKELVAEAGVEKREIPVREIPEGLEAKIEEIALQDLKDAIHIEDRAERKKALKELKNGLLEQLEEDYPESEKLIKKILHDLEKREVRIMVTEEGKRLDGRKVTEIRPISCETDLLPRAHGSALFTRGQTQALGIITLGSKRDEQIVDALEGEYRKKYQLHYNFPPFCTGEAKPIRGVSRREIGHGNLAERALKPVIPLSDDFPYTIRVVSEVLESNGSSSMATVCAGSMSLMAAGIPVKGAVAGIAMGLIKENDKIAILSDILGDEDHLGDMDFKVAGTKDGITAVQMDIKIDGISQDVMAQALAQAKEGRAHIMGEMDKEIEEARKELSQYAPRILFVTVPTDKIGAIIGPGGKTIQGIVAETGAEIDIEDTGVVTIASPDLDSAEAARKMVEAIIEVPKVGRIYNGKVRSIKDFGAFIEILPGKDGMVHISELDIKRVNKVTDVLKEGDKVDVMVKSVSPDGKVSLSIKSILLKKQKEDQAK